MTVVIMTPARALSADYGSYIFANVRGSVTSVGVKMNKHRISKNLNESVNFPLSTKWNRQQCHWPKSCASKMFGFNEAM